MSMYYFHLYDHETIRDSDGTELVDVIAARKHAVGVARELTFKTDGISDQDWSAWTMRVHDHQDVELFSLSLSDFTEENSGK
jgi:hypothetical protein